jgi:hypothetical protein
VFFGERGREFHSEELPYLAACGVKIPRLGVLKMRRSRRIRRFGSADSILRWRWSDSIADIVLAIGALAWEGIVKVKD